MVKTVRLSRKEFKERFGDAEAMTVFEGDEPTVYIPGRASTGEMLHEIYHAAHSPNIEEYYSGEREFETADELALEELRAEEFRAEHQSPGGSLPGVSIEIVAKVLLDSGFKPATIMGSINRALETLGYKPLDKEDRHRLWGRLRRESGEWFEE